MHLISIDASPRQLSRLRNGHRVRIKKGTGFNLIVSPTTYHRVSRTFVKSKGVDVSLSPEEIDANKMYSPERHAEIKADMDKLSLPAPAEGAGIFHKAGKWLKRAGKHIAKAATGKVVSSIIKAGAPALATALLGPAGAPVGALIGDVAAKHASSATEKAVGKQMGVGLYGRGPVQSVLKSLTESHNIPADYYHQGQPALRVGSKAHHLAKKHAQQLKRELESPPAYAGGPCTGRGVYHGFHSLRESNIGTHEADKALKSLSDRHFGSRFHSIPNEDYYDAPLAPRSRGTAAHGHGLYAGRGLYSGGGLFAGGAIKEESIVGKNGGFIHHLPPALQSQPYSANFHFQFQLPPQYQQYEQGPSVEY